MTIEDKIREMLVERGMFDSQAVEVVEAMKVDKINEPMEHRWMDEADDYPPQMLTILWIGAKHQALKYIDANCPKAWFRPMFT